jgi:hypothetical protein
MPTEDTTMRHLRDEYTTKIKLQLDELNLQIGAMEGKMQEAKAELRASYRAELAKLRLQSEQANDKLGQLQASGEAQWDKMVLEMDKVRDAFVNSYNYFKAQL